LEVELFTERDVSVTEERREAEAIDGHRLIVRSSSDGRIGQSFVPIVVWGTIEAVTRRHQHHLFTVAVNKARVSPVILVHMGYSGELEGEHNFALRVVRGNALGIICHCRDIGIMITVMRVTVSGILFHINCRLRGSQILNELFGIGRSVEVSAQGHGGQLVELLTSATDGELNAVD
jgi:hypothetical protein